MRPRRKPLGWPAWPAAGRGSARRRGEAGTEFLLSTLLLYRRRVSIVCFLGGIQRRNDDEEVRRGRGREGSPGKGKRRVGKGKGKGRGRGQEWSFVARGNA